jgi:hypothetical protein
LALLLCACASNPSTPPLRVNLPSTCGRILKTVPLPPVKATDDARQAFVRDDAALITAHGEIEAGRNCITDENSRYAASRQ